MSAYEPYESEKIAFGKNWIAPTRYPHAEDKACAFYAKTPGGDGQNVTVDCCAMPARFYKITAHPSANSVGEPIEGFLVSTGSGCAALAASIAKAISEGMLSFERLPS